MADDLPPGFRLDPPAAGGGGDLPPGFKLDEPTGTTHEAEGPVAPTREQEIRRDALKRLMAADIKQSSGRATDPTLLLSGSEPGFTERLKDQVTSGVMRPISGVMSIAEGLAKEYLGGGKPATVGEYYRGGVGAEEDYQARARENTSKGWKAPLGVATDVAGSLVGGGTSTGATRLGTQMLQSGAQGAIEGASRNASDPVEAGKGAVIGGTVAAGGTGLLGALGERLGRVKGAREDLGIASRQGNAQTLEREGSAVFQRLDNAGFTFSPTDTASLASAVRQRLTDEGFNRNMHRRLVPVLNDIGGASGQRATWSQLRNMQTQISDLRANPDPRLRRIAGELGDELDTFIRSTPPMMPQGSAQAGINPAEVDTARNLWHRGSQARKVEALAEKGTLTSSEPTTTVAGNFGAHHDKHLEGTKYNPLGSPEQARLVRSIAESGPTAARAAKLDAQAANVAKYGVLGSAGLLAAPSLGIDVGDKTSTTGILGSLALAAALKGRGAQLSRQATRQGTEGINDLMRNIVTGQTAPQAGAYVPRQALAMLLAKQDAARGFGNYLGSFIDKEQPQ